MAKNEHKMMAKWVNVTKTGIRSGNRGLKSVLNGFKVTKMSQDFGEMGRKNWFKLAKMG